MEPGATVHLHDELSRHSVLTPADWRKLHQANYLKLLRTSKECGGGANCHVTLREAKNTLL